MDTSFSAFYRAWLDFSKGKSSSLAIDEFEYQLDSNLQELVSEISAGIYRHGKYKKITIHEKKRRDLAVATVRDRVVHRLLYDYLVVIYDKSFDPDVWSCRQGKGLHKCLSRTQKLLNKLGESYVWRADITKFFDSVDHYKLLECLKRKIGDNKSVMYLLSEIINSYNSELRATRKASSYELRATSYGYTHWQFNISDI